VPLVSTRALILQAFPYSDTSKVLRLYTPHLGLRSVIAKGAQRPRSRVGGLLEPFTEGDAQFYLREGRDLHTLGGFDLLRSRQGLGRNLVAFCAASLLAELTLRFGTEEPFPELYGSVVQTLDRLQAEQEPAATARLGLAGVWRVVALLGFRPEMECCVRCARPLETAEPSRFDADAGGAACLACRPAGRQVAAAVRGEVVRMCEGGEGEPRLLDRPLHAALLTAFLTAHLTQEHPLRSLALFREQFESGPRAAEAR
jgi:DNA repair protein RecO (recombination protein O)